LQVGSLSRRLAQLALAEGDHGAAHGIALEAARFFEAFLAQQGHRAREPVRLGARRHVTQALLLVARAELALGRAGDADRTLRRAEGYALLVGSAEVDVDLASIKAEAALARGDAGRALGLLQQAAGPARRLQKRHTLVELHHAMARALLALGRVIEALASIRTSLDLVEGMRAEFLALELRSGFLEERQRLYRLAVQVALEAGSEAEAFAFAERARARAFLDLLGSETALSKARAAALAQEELRLRARMAEVRMWAEDEDDIDQVWRQTRVEAVEREYQAFLEQVRKESLEQDLTHGGGTRDAGRDPAPAARGDDAARVLRDRPADGALGHPSPPDRGVPPGR
jgi:hypothetical protein